MNLNAIAHYLAASKLGVIGKTLFVTELPANCDTGVLLMGSYGGTDIDPELPDYYKDEFRVVVRSKDYESGEKLAKQISSKLKTPMGLTLKTMQIKTMRPLNLPRPYRRSVGGYWEFEVGVSIVFHDTDP